MITRAKQVQAEVIQSAYRIWLAGLGALAMAQESGGELFNDLVKRGREMEAHARMSTPDMSVTFRDATGKAMTTFQQLSKGLDEQVTAALHRMGVPTRSEIATLGKQVEDRLQDTSKAVLQRFGVPSHAEINALIARVEQLTAKVESISRKEAADDHEG